MTEGSMEGQFYGSGSWGQVAASYGPRNQPGTHAHTYARTNTRTHALMQAGHARSSHLVASKAMGHV